ncbi:VOC family protein [Nocardia rhizosphaerae]|uniref:VOC family protein n=1 Tax=Nocardia rhizosphaerae TaxID=1691571 RepID=A0ABV8LB66_9NOCA
MPDPLGINHLTLATTDLDRLLAFYTEFLGATRAFERAATPPDPRIAVVDVGGDDNLMIVETASARSPGSIPCAVLGGDCGSPHTLSSRTSAYSYCTPDTR